jgi:hypothetical protein
VNRLLVTDEDDLCLHPLFAFRFDSKSLRGPEREFEKPIQPLGSDPSSHEEFTRYVHLNSA